MVFCCVRPCSWQEFSIASFFQELRFTRLKRSFGILRDPARSFWIRLLQHQVTIARPVENFRSWGLNNRLKTCVVVYWILIIYSMLKVLIVLSIVGFYRQYTCCILLCVLSSKVYDLIIKHISCWIAFNISWFHSLMIRLWLDTSNFTLCQMNSSTLNLQLF